MTGEGPFGTLRPGFFKKDCGAEKTIFAEQL